MVITMLVMPLIAFVVGWILVMDSDQNQRGMVVGVVMSALTSILNYWIGRSHGETRKDVAQIDMQRSREIDDRA